MPDVVILLLPDGSGCGGAGCSCDAGGTPLVPVLTCADAFRQGGARVEAVTACDDAEIDSAIHTAETNGAALVVAASSDGHLRTVLRRMVRRKAPPPSQRPAALPPSRTVFDLPPIGVLPLLPAVPALAARLGLPRDAVEVAAAVLAGDTRRFDLLRNDAGSVTLHGALFGGVDERGAVGVWRGRVEVDDAVLTDGEEPVIACAVANAGPADVDGLPLIVEADPTDAVLDVAVAVPVVARRPLRGPSVRFEVRRARGRAVSVNPRQSDLPFADDGLTGVLTHKRTWWVEPAVWAAYVR